MTEKPPISLSVSIVSYHSPPDQLQAPVASLAGAIQVLNNADGPCSISVILIDNSESGAVSVELVRKLENALATVQVPLTLIQGNGNIGYGAGHNLAINSSRADFHLILNPDVNLAPNSLSEGLAYLQEHPEVLLASPRAYGMDGERQHLCKRYPSVALLLLRGFLPGLLGSRFAHRQSVYEMHDLDQEEPTEDVLIASGCFMLCRRSALQESGGFDDRYFLYFEDFDLSLRLGRLGTLAYLPSMEIVHGGGQAARKGLRHIGMFMRSGIRFFNQWGWRWF